MLNKVFKFFKSSTDKEITTTLSNEFKIENLYETLDIDTLKILIGEDLSPLKSSFQQNIDRLRELIKDEYGFIFPNISIQESFTFQENEYQIFINNKCVFNDFAIPTTTYIETNFLDSLKKVIDKNIDTIFTNKTVEKYINFAQKDNFWLIWNLTSVLSMVEIKTILIDLIKKKKSIHNINYIFEKICDDIFVENNSKNPHKISERLAKIL